MQNITTIEKRQIWEKERSRLIDISNAIDSRSIKKCNVHLISSKDYKELKKIVEDGNVGFEYDKLQKINYYCDSCNPAFPKIVVQKGYWNAREFVSPSIGANDVKIYSQLIIPKESVLRKINEAYKEIENFGLEKLDTHRIENIQTVFKLALDKKESNVSFNGFLDKMDGGYLMHMCERCEKDGKLEDVKNKYLHNTENSLAFIGLDKTDYNLITRLEKTLIWSPK